LEDVAERCDRKSQTPGDATKDTAAGESGGQFPSDMSEMKLVSRPESSLQINEINPTIQ